MDFSKNSYVLFEVVEEKFITIYKYTNKFKYLFGHSYTSLCVTGRGFTG